VNKDGIHDLILGAPTLANSGGVGAAVVIFGKASGWTDVDLASFTSGSAGFWMLGTSGDECGISVGAGGDVNGDGIDDVLVGAKLADPLGRTDAGISYVVFGHDKSVPFNDMNLGSFSSGSLGFRVFGAADFDYNGHAVAGGFDMNGDGYGDVVVSSILYDGPPGDFKYICGAVYVIFGHSAATAFTDIDLAALSNSQGFRVTGANAQDWLGFSVSSAGDFNDDGYGDVVVGARNAAPSTRGRAYIIFGHSNTLSFPDQDMSSFTSGPTGFQVVGAGTGDQLGWSVSGGADVNGDGIDDIILGANYADPSGRSDGGIVYVLYGRASTLFMDVDLSAGLSSGLGYRVLGESAGDQLGFCAGAVTDFDGDEVADMAIAASSADPSGRTDAGSAFLIYGEAASPAQQGPTPGPTASPTPSPTARPTTAMPTLSTCPPGTHYANSSAPDVCIRCAPGTYSNTYGGAAVCTRCPRGQFAKDAGAIECTKCAIGSYADRNGTVTCTACGVGTFSVAEGATSSNTCQGCPLGSYSAGLGSSSCGLCSLGQYADQTGSSACTVCPANRLTPGLGTASAGDCLNPAANFVQGALALAATCLLAGVYILRGRMNAVGFGRRRHLQEAGKTYVALIRAVNRVPLDAEPETMTKFQKRLMRAALVVGALIAFFGSTFACLAMLFAQVFFAAMIIWRNMRLLVHIPFMERVTAAVSHLDEVIGAVVPVRYLFGWIFVVVEAMGSLGINLSAMQVTCVGSQAPIVLLVNVVLFVAIVILIECGVASFLATTFFRTHREYRSVILNSRARNTIDYPASVKARRWLFSNIETAIFSSNLIVYVLQYAVSFISIGEFFQYYGRHASTPACDNISGVPGIDTALAFVSTILTYMLIPAVMYNISKLLVPRLLQKDKLPPKDLSSISHDSLVQSIRNQPVTMTWSCIPSVDCFVSWRFKWAYNVLHAPKHTKPDELMFLNKEDEPIIPPTGIGICPIVSDINPDFQKEWVEECEERLPHFGFRLIGASYYYFGTVVQNFCEFLLVLLGVWDAGSVRKFNIINTLVYNGFELDQYLQQPEYDHSSKTPAHRSFGKLCYRTLCCFFRDVEYKRVLPDDGGESSLQVAALVAAELSTRATLFLLFPFGGLITTYVSATAANPIFCSRAKKLNKLLPPLLVFDSDLLAKKRIEQMGGSRAEWKVRAMSVYIFTTESRLIQYSYKLIRYLMGVSLSVYPVLPFLVAGVLVTVVYGMVASIYPIVVLANILEVNDDEEKTDGYAAPGSMVNEVDDIEGSESNKSAGLTKQHSLSRPVTVRAASLRGGISAGTVSSEQEGMSRFKSEFYSGYDEDSDCEGSDDGSAAARQTTERAAAATAFAIAAGQLGAHGGSTLLNPRDLELVEQQGANARRRQAIELHVEEENLAATQLSGRLIIAVAPGDLDEVSVTLGVELTNPNDEQPAELATHPADDVELLHVRDPEQSSKYHHANRE
jgi:hypothetical protein